MEAQSKGPEEVPVVEGVDALNVHTVAGKLVLSIVKNNAADFLVRDLTEDLSVKLSVPPQQLCLLRGVQALEMGAALRPMISGEGSLDLCLVVDTSKAAQVQDRFEADEPIPEDVCGEGHRFVSLMEEAEMLRDQETLTKLRRH